MSRRSGHFTNMRKPAADLGGLLNGRKGGRAQEQEMMVITNSGAEHGRVLTALAVYRQPKQMISASGCRWLASGGARQDDARLFGNLSL